MARVGLVGLLVAPVLLPASAVAALAASVLPSPSLPLPIATPVLPGGLLNPTALPAPNPTAVRDSLIRTVLGPVPNEVAVFPVLLPLLAGLLLLLLSAALAAHRRTQEAARVQLGS